jgi:hypothetical protein
MNMKEVNEIRGRIGTLEAKLRDAEQALSDAGLRAIGLCVGDIIVAHKGSSREALVCVRGCDARYGTPRPTGVKVKADGTPGHASAGYISDWEKP